MAEFMNHLFSASYADSLIAFATHLLTATRQDAWRRCQTPASIKLSDLCEDEWEVIRDTEDEMVHPFAPGSS